MAVIDSPAFVGSAFYSSLGRRGEKEKGREPRTPKQCSSDAGVGEAMFTPSVVRGQHAEQFGVVHYAGEVLYTATGWLDKNRLSMPTALSLLMRRTKATLLQATLGGWTESWLAVLTHPWCRHHVSNFLPPLCSRVSRP